MLRQEKNVEKKVRSAVETLAVSLRKKSDSGVSSSPFCEAKLKMSCKVTVRRTVTT